MSETVIFEPKAGLDAKKNLAQFISLCRYELTGYNASLDWGDWSWTSDIKGMSGVQFVQLRINPRNVEDKDLLHEKFIDFAKAYFRYHFSNKPTANTRNQLMKPLRALERAFIDNDIEPDVTQITEEILDLAQDVIVGFYSKTAAYQGGAQLEALAKFISKKELCSNYLDWSHSIPRAQDNNKTGIEGKRNRMKKLPSQDALNALAEIYASNPGNELYRYVSAGTLMMLCQPSRVGELNRLTVDCDEIPDEYLKYVDSEGVANTGYGWKYNAEKGYDPEIKWIPISMQALAKDALDRIKQMTQPARNFAFQMEEVIASKNPKFPRHPLCPDVRDDQLLTGAEMIDALGFSSRVQLESTIRELDYFGKSGKTKYKYTLNDLVGFLIEELPAGFPWIDKSRGLKYSNALFCFFHNQIAQVWGTVKTKLWIPDNNTLTSKLKSHASGADSIFEVLGYNQGRDEPLKVTTKMFRHYLNTIAQEGELSQEIIAKWSGRKDIGQNVVYNHESHEDRVNKLRKYGMNTELMGADLDIEINVPVTITEFITLERAPVHHSEFGFCEHDYALEPCLKYRDCANCEEEVCIKGDIESLDRLKNFRDKEALVVERDEHCIETGDLKMEDQSYQYHLKKLARLNQKIAILESDEIPDGSQVRLKNPLDITPFERAMVSRNRMGINSGENQFANKALESARKKSSKLQSVEENKSELDKLLGGFSLG
jgi:hypothetical protein